MNKKILEWKTIQKPYHKQPRLKHNIACTYELNFSIIQRLTHNDSMSKDYHLFPSSRVHPSCIHLVYMDRTLSIAQSNTAAQQG